MVLGGVLLGGWGRRLSFWLFLCVGLLNRSAGNAGRWTDGRMDDNDDHRSVGGRESKFENGYLWGGGHGSTYLFISTTVYQHDRRHGRPPLRVRIQQGGNNATAN